VRLIGLVPTKFGLLLYPGFEVLDVFGPVEALNVISRKEFQDKLCIPYVQNVSLSIIAEDLNPISPAMPGDVGSVLGQQFTLQYLITICTGADIAARAGILDGKRATTNKQAWV
jgi:hypothetical protein